ncbi:MAG: hypothetical protein JRG76_10715 [Deltaproteobacteria bacterium]|nr:hypothetical protein [Deltaproteobacteria bacterium]MBW2414969.1 hypothetical protein [Deltaproteobacteria bacterium]
MSVACHVALALLLAASGLVACYEPIPPSQRIWANEVTSSAGLWPEVRDAVDFDPDTSFDRNGSLTVQSTGESMFLLFVIDRASFDGKALANSLISYQAHLRTRGLEGQALIHLGVRMSDGETHGAKPGEETPPLEGDADWVLQEANLLLEPGEVPEAIFLMLEVTGTGQVWIDNMRVLTTPVS